MTGLMMRQSLFERALSLLETQAAGDLGHFTPRGLARQYLLVERASGEVEDSAIGAELGQRSTRLLESVAEAVSRDVGDVAAKLAVAIIEGDNGASGAIAEAHQAILAHALAELVILAAGPLPSTGAFMGMTGAELELREVPIGADEPEPARATE